MKPTITLLLCLLLCPTGYTQGISAGMRTGITKSQDIQQLKQGAIHYTWDKELFIRYETSGRFAMETNLNQYNYEEYDPSYSTILICWPTEDYYNYTMLYQINDMSMIDFGVSLQYDALKKKKES